MHSFDRAVASHQSQKCPEAFVGKAWRVGPVDLSAALRNRNVSTFGYSLLFWLSRRVGKVITWQDARRASVASPTAFDTAFGECIYAKALELRSMGPVSAAPET